MIRDLISVEFNRVIEEIGLQIYADQWKNPQFQVLFQSLKLVSPSNGSDEFWHIHRLVEGTILVRFYSDESVPIDPTLIMLETTLKPLLIKPEPMTIPVDTLAFQASIVFEKCQDLMYQDGYMPQIEAKIRGGMILKRIQSTPIPNSLHIRD